MIPGRRLRVADFYRSFQMLQYPSILFPFIYYFWGWTFINVMPAISIATIYTHFYRLGPGPIGAMLGVSLTIGSILGEFFAGRASDYVMLRMALRVRSRAKMDGDLDGKKGVKELETAGANEIASRIPETRLYLTPLSAIFMPVGLIVFGCTVGTHSPYIPLIGLGIGVFGLQIASTCLYAYVSDCYKPQTPESGVLFNLSRGLSFVVGYFALPFAEETGYAAAWGTFAAVLFVGWLPIGALMIWGERWRRRMGEPGFHRDL